VPSDFENLIARPPCYPDLRGQVALITGGGTGIGRGIARRLAAEGMKVAICGRRADRLAETATLIESDGGEVLAAPADVNDPDQLSSFVDRALDRFGQVDALVHNAMFMSYSSFADHTLEQWDQSFATGARAAYLLCQRIAPAMLERGRGGIVLISSVQGSRPNRIGLAYVAVKGALEAMTRQLAISFADRGVRVNAVAPGRILTRREPTPDNMSNELIPLGRAGTPAEMAAVVAFLLSQQSSYITGQVIHADGGISVQLVPPGLRL
jgi:NAD(P)-dependent dehydrogenase (short-subunit alcohol dehydrogenase family)